MFLQHDIEEWAEEKGIYEDGGNFISQMKGIAEETVEATESFTLGATIDLEKELGDIYVWWINACKVAEVDPHTAARAAVDKIRGRKGVMMNGRFVKDND